MKNLTSVAANTYSLLLFLMLHQINLKQAHQRKRMTYDVWRIRCFGIRPRLARVIQKHLHRMIGVQTIVPQRLNDLFDSHRDFFKR